MNRIFNQTNGPIGPLDETVMETIRRLWDRKAKPLGSLGRLEDMVVQLGGIFGTEHIDISKKAVIVMAADNGVIREGVAQSDAHVTSTVVGNMARGASTVSILAQMAGADVFPVDIGMADDLFCPGVLNRKVRRGTDNIAMGPAMSRAEAVRAMEIGIEIVGMLYKRGYRLIATGEMGIGNTTTSSAMAAVYLGLDAAKVTGRGAGLDRQGYEKKIRVIRQAIKKNHPDANDGLDVLHKVGGLDIAGLTRLLYRWSHLPGSGGGGWIDFCGSSPDCCAPGTGLPGIYVSVSLFGRAGGAAAFECLKYDALYRCRYVSGGRYWCGDRLSFV